MRYLACVLALLIVNVYCQIEEWTDREIYYTTIAQGTVVGTRPEGLNYLEFHGIPYADSTSGVNRFKAPRPAPSFVDIFYANRTDVKCVRPLGEGYEGTEDCLVANVITPTLDTTRQLPVMVWVKGKEFDKVYEHDLTFKNFAEQDVVVVSLNYRESILGYLCLGTEAAPGNAGLKDIIAGLQWVRDNIEQFGGNPNSITLFGHGSGAAAVDLVTLSPLSKDLVHKAISQSGTAMAPWAVARDNLKYAITVAEALGHQISEADTLSEIFTRTSLGALMGVINELELTDNSLAFSPCVENADLENGRPFLVKSPYQILNEQDFEPIPFITGFVDKEGTIKAEEAVEDSWLEKMQTSFSDFIQPDLEFVNETQRDQVAHQIRNFYFGDRLINLDNIEDYISYHGDTMILVSALREAQLRTRASSTSVFVYQFSYKGSLGEPFVGPLEVDGTAHSEDLAYLLYDSTDTVSIDLAVSDILIERWTNFAKTGEPSSTKSQVIWKPFTSESRSYIRILNDAEINLNEGATLEIDLENPHPITLAFWTQIYEEFYKDAAGRWDILDTREEDIIDSTEGVDGTDTDIVTEVPDPDEVTGVPDPEPGSASTAVSYTFLITSLFAILNKFHLSQISS